MFSADHHIQMIRSSDKGDAARSGIYQMLCGLLGSLSTIGHHTGEQFMQTSAGKEHQGDAHVVNLLEMTVVYGILRQTGDDTRHVHIDEVVDHCLLTLMIFMRVGTDDCITIFQGILLYSIEHRGIVVGHQIGHHHPDLPRHFHAQTLSEGVRTVVQILSQLLYALLHLITHLMRITECTRHRGHADTQLSCQIFQGYSTFLRRHNTYKLDSYLLFTLQR